MKNGYYTDTEQFILKEFFEGKSVTALVRDYLQTYDVTRSEAEKIIYKVLYDGALIY